MLTPQQILERLAKRLDLLKGGRDADPRQQTLRATIEWSHELLTPGEQRLFARLSVFRGGWTLEAAEQVAEADLDTLQSLVDKSLVRHRDDRFWMLETIREYAAERLEARGEAEELRRRHAQNFLALAEDVEPKLLGGSREWHDRLEAAHDNLRAALDWLATSGESHHALRLAGALTRFWSERGHHAEGQRRLENALGADRRRTAARGKALNGAALMAITRADTATARRRAEEGLTIHRELGDPWGAARSTYMLALASRDEGELVTAQRLFEESAQAFRQLGDEPYAGLATFNLAWMSGELGDTARERELHEENLRRAVATGNGGTQAASLDSLAHFAREEGRTEEALSMERESLRIHADLGDVMKTGDSLTRIARALATEGGARTAARLLAAVEALYEETGVSTPSWVAKIRRDALDAMHTQLDDAALDEAWQEGRALSVDDAVELALDY